MTKFIKIQTVESVTKLCETKIIAQSIKRSRINNKEDTKEAQTDKLEKE